MLDVNQKIEIKISKDLVPYQEALDFMELRVKQILEGSNSQALWFLEHPPIYTAGTGSSMQDVLCKQFEVVQTGRGGKITYHGPNQRVVYLMLNLKDLYKTDKPDLHKFVSDLESWIIKSLSEVGLCCFTKSGMVGVWTNHRGVDEKIAAIGIRVKKWICFHGIAINVNPNLEHFSGIIPCGIQEFGITSLHKLGFSISLETLDSILISKFHDIFL
jgi:lipoyl(octanoyl) transferase